MRSSPWLLRGTRKKYYLIYTFCDFTEKEEVHLLKDQFVLTTASETGGPDPA